MNDSTPAYQCPVCGQSATTYEVREPIGVVRSYVAYHADQNGHSCNMSNCSCDWVWKQAKKLAESQEITLRPATRKGSEKWK